jgi:phosphatidylinositol-3-phosphatase
MARTLAVSLGLAVVLLAGCATPPPASPSPSTAGPLTPPPSGSGPGSSASEPPSPMSGSLVSPLASASASPLATGLPDFSHIYLIVLENKEDSSIIGNAQAPYLNRLARTYGLATNYNAIGHPSQPNYLVLASGSTGGVRDDANHDLSQPSVFDQVEASGRTWQVAAQNDRLGCYTGATARGGPDGPGTYARKHNPAISFSAISRSPTRCARITDFSHFDPAAASFNWIVPNLCNTMHDCSIATGDAWLGSFLPSILASPAWLQGGLILLTFDEGTTNDGGGGRVATIVISPLGRPGFSSAVAHDHDSLLRTIEDAWRLPCLAGACQANDMAEFFR